LDNKPIFLKLIDSNGYVDNIQLLNYHQLQVISTENTKFWVIAEEWFKVFKKIADLVLLYESTRYPITNALVDYHKFTSVIGELTQLTAPVKK
jgi:hypothetical protein